MFFKILGLLCVLILLFLYKAQDDRKKDKKKLEIRLSSEWGRKTREEYSDQIMGNITSFFRHQKEETTGEQNWIDDITWNDLNLTEIYQRINHTRTSAGEAVLYDLLRRPLYEEEKLLHREKMISGFLERETERQKMEEALLAIGKLDHFSVYDYLLKTRELKAFSKLPHLFCALLLSVGTILIFFLPAWYLLVYLLLLLFNTFFYFHTKGKHITDITLFHFIFRLIHGCKAIRELSFPELSEEITKIRDLTDKFRRYERFHFLVADGSSMSGSVFDSLFDYVRILFHVDLIKISTMVTEIRKYETELLSLFELIGTVDAMLAVSSYRVSLEKYAVPVFTENVSCDRTVTIKKLYHPLVDAPVKNDLIMTKSILLTGSNASGKSTFLKAVAVNVIFAQTIHTVLADSYQAAFYRVFSSMALRDDILAKESYFIVEIKSLKRLFDAGDDPDLPVFCFVDEILRGTNTVERVAASSMLLENLAGKNAICMAATHDIELTYLLKKGYDNYHFEEKVETGDICFDYRLKKGRAESRNAILLMKSLGFQEEMTEKAEKRVENFLSEGIWK